MKLPDKVYDVLKWLSCIVFNAIGVLYKTLAAAWNLPFGEQVQITCAAIATFLGALICISTVQYNAQKRLEKDPFSWHDKEIE